MDGKAQSSTIHSSETADNSPPSSRPQQNEAAHEAAEYLRSFGLTVPYEDIFQSWMLDEPRKLVELPDDPTGLTPCDGLVDCTIPPTASAPEQWDVHDKSLSLLRDVCMRQSEAEVEDCVRQIRERAEADSVRRLKFELPALRTDNEIDFRRYQRRIRVARQVHLSAHHLPLEPCDEDKDEGLEFPPQAHAADRQIVQTVEGEKIEISKHAFETLLRHLKADWTEADQDAMLRCQVEYKGLIPREPVTPPLTPIIQAQDVFVPDEETCNVPQPSDPSSLVSADLRKAEDRLFDENGDNPDVSMADIEQLMDFDSTDEVDLILLPDSVQKRDDLTVEEPLMSAVIQDGTQVSPDFGDIRESIALANTTSDDVPCQDTEKHLTESLKETAARVMMEIEQEKLEPLDATIRVDVPIVDFSIPEPEWCNQLGDSLAIFRSIPRQSDVMFNGIRWTRKLVEESKMIWRIWISREPRPAHEAPIEDEALLVAYLEPPEDASVPTSSDFVRKQPGLAILRDNEDDDEDEIQPLISPPQPLQGDWMALIKKRKLFLDDDESQRKSTPKTLPGDELRSDRPRAVPGKLLVQDDEGAAAALLDSYMEMHAPKKMRPEHSPYFKATQSRIAKEPQAAKQIHDKNSQQSDVPMAKASRPPENAPHKTPAQVDVPTTQVGRLMVCPDIPHLDRPLKMVVAVNIQRGMIQHLERLLPGLQMIDRDYNAHNMSVWMPGSVRRSETASSIADEADLIPSPSTGIVLTTLIKVRQKPLPGGPKAKPSLTSRIESIAARYERLVVLVSEGNKLDESASAVSASDAAALVGLQAFAATLPAETTVLYVGGGVETLARWAAAVAARHAAGCAAHVRDYLAQDETHWELFLRRAGMNAYAAQVVLGMLRAPEGEPLLNHERAYGLPALVKMSAEQRSAMFEGVLGGRRVLASVGRVLDARWGDVVSGKS